MIVSFINDMLQLLKYILLGIIQGVAEILPISSSGHLVFYKAILGVDLGGNLTFEVLLHFASLLALLVFFREKIVDLMIGFYQYVFKKKQEYHEKFMLVIYLIVATIPVMLVGLFLEDVVISIFSSLIYVAFGFLITAGVLYFVYRMKPGAETKMNYKKAVVIGLAQCVGVMPGISRSGMTLSAARAQNLELRHAKDFAFLLFLPVSLGSFILSLNDLSLTIDNQFILNFIAMIFAFIFTLLALIFIFKKLQYRHYKYFSFYCFMMGIATYILSFMV